MSKSKPYPLKIRAPLGATVMTIDWSDGHVGLYPHHILRGYCPCAECQGHSGTIEYRQGGDLEIRELGTVGNYAITVTWGDRHSTGIYNFDYLRMLCRCPSCRTPGDSDHDPPLPKP